MVNNLIIILVIGQCCKPCIHYLPCEKEKIEYKGHTEVSIEYALNFDKNILYTGHPTIFGKDCLNARPPNIHKQKENNSFNGGSSSNSGGSHICFNKFFNKSEISIDINNDINCCKASCVVSAPSNFLNFIIGALIISVFIMREKIKCLCKNVLKMISRGFDGANAANVTLTHQEMKSL